MHHIIKSIQISNMNNPIFYNKSLNFFTIYNVVSKISCIIPLIIGFAKENIIKEFNGANYAFLAYKYNLSERAVREIVKRARGRVVCSKCSLLS